jgi:hypothetical protein
LQPFAYSFNNNCDPASANPPGTFHVTISGPSNTKFDVPPLQTVTGQLPSGKYGINWQPDAGAGQQITWSSDQGPLNVKFC